MNFLSVFLGIVITFAGNAWITHRHEKKEVREALVLVSEELRENIASMENVQRAIDAEYEAAAYLTRFYGHYEDCAPDSMAAYCNLPLALHPSNVTDEALELLKTSGLFQKIEDKEVALDIIRAYRSLHELADNYEYYKNKKQKLLDAAMQDEAKQLFARPDFTGPQMWNALTSTVEGREFLQEIVTSSQLGFYQPETTRYVGSVAHEVDSVVAKM